MALKTDIRVQLLGEDNITVLSDVYLTLIISDAKSFTGITDESNIALRWYSCHLVALNWDSVGAISRREGVTYIAPDPIKYLNKYEEKIVQDSGTDLSSIGYKVSTNESNEVNDCGVLVTGTPDCDN